MTTQELIDQLHDLQLQLEARGDVALDGAILEVSNAIELLENSALASIAAKLEAQEAELDAGIAALKKDVQALGSIVNVIEDIAKLAKTVAKLV